MDLNTRLRKLFAHDIVPELSLPIYDSSPDMIAMAMKNNIPYLQRRGDRILPEMIKGTITAHQIIALLRFAAKNAGNDPDDLDIKKFTTITDNKDIIDGEKTIFVPNFGYTIKVPPPEFFGCIATKDTSSIFDFGKTNITEGIFCFAVAIMRE